METVIAVVIGFLLTALVGNRLVHSLQARNWLLQQRFAGEEKDYLALKELSEEIASLLGVRIYRMQRVLYRLNGSSMYEIEQAAAEHDEAVTRWNERLTYIFVRLRYLKSEGMAYQLDKQIQKELRECAENLSALKLTRQKSGRVSERTIAELLNRTYELQRLAQNFNDSLLAAVNNRRYQIYYGTNLTFDVKNLEHFSTWFLFKALFVRDVKSLSVLRSTFDT